MSQKMLDALNVAGLDYRSERQNEVAISSGGQCLLGAGVVNVIVDSERGGRGWQVS